MITLRTQDPEGDFNRKDTRFVHEIPVLIDLKPHVLHCASLPHIIFKTKGTMERIRKGETSDSQGIPAINYFQTRENQTCI